MDQLAILATLGSIAASMVGFAGLLTAFRAANERLDPNDVTNIRILLIFSVSALVYSLIPLPFAAGDLADGRVWRSLSIILGAYLLFWTVQSPRWMRRKRLRPRRPLLYVVMLAIQGLLGVAMVWGGLMSEQAHALYVVGVLWCLITAIVVFVAQIFRMLPLSQPPSTE
ncbi:MAG: hypothetical protein V4696_08540 [Pseudomonadota bacterium]